MVILDTKHRANSAMLLLAIFFLFAPIILASDNSDPFESPRDDTSSMEMDEDVSPFDLTLPFSPLQYEPATSSSVPLETTVLYSYVARANDLEYTVMRNETVHLFSRHQGWCRVGADDLFCLGYVPCSFLADDTAPTVPLGDHDSLGAPPDPIDVIHLKSAEKGKALFATDNNWCLVAFGGREEYVPCAYLKVTGGLWRDLLDRVSDKFVSSLKVPSGIAPGAHRMIHLKFKLNQDNVIEMPSKYNAAAILGRSKNDWCLVEPLEMDEDGPVGIGGEGIVPCAFLIGLDASTHVTPYTPQRDLPRITLATPFMDYGGHYQPSHNLLIAEMGLLYIVVNQPLHDGWLEVSNPVTGEWGFVSSKWFPAITDSTTPSPTLPQPISGLTLPPFKAHRPFIVKVSDSNEYAFSSYVPGLGCIAHRIVRDKQFVDRASTQVPWLQPPSDHQLPVHKSFSAFIRFVGETFWKTFDMPRQLKQFQDLTLGSPIGKWNFGSVHRVTFKSKGNLPSSMVVKAIRMTMPSSAKPVLDEIMALLRMKGCKNVPVLHHVHLIAQQDGASGAFHYVAYLLMDYIDGHSLSD